MSQDRSLPTKSPGALSQRSRYFLIAALVLIPLYAVYVSGLATNPPAFYIDEASVSYNAYTIYQRGEGEFGHPMPLYFPVFPLGPPFNYLGYVEPTQIYALAALHFIFSPSVELSRGLSATAMFLAGILLGFLAWRISDNRLIGIIVGATALLTPWLFEIGRLAFGAALYPLMIVLLLSAIYRAYSKERWSLLDCVLIAISLALATYTYAIGRLLGPLLAFGLILFVTDLKRAKSVFITWVLYALTIVPILIFHLRNPNALTGRLNMTVGYITPQKSYRQIFSEFVGHYYANIDPYRLLLTGDGNARHHIPDAPAILAVTLVMALVGILIILLKYRRFSWWWFQLYGLVVSIVPASLTRDDFHTLRLSAFPVFLLVMTIPTWMWLVGATGGQWRKNALDSSAIVGKKLIRAFALSLLVSLLLIQAVFFQIRFAHAGPLRGGYFDYNFPPVFAAALEQPERPIYLADQFYYHAVWQSIVQGVDPSNFVQLPPRSRPPANSIVLSGEEKCTDCIMMVKDIPFVLYKTLGGPPAPAVATNPASDAKDLDSVPFSMPRGIATDSLGNYYVADTGNSRIQKYDPAGKFSGGFGSRGQGEGELWEPQGIAVSSAGDIYVTDALNHKLLLFKSDGTFVKEWNGPDLVFYGPRDIEFDANGILYIVDQGRTRIVRFDPAAESFGTFGSAGTGEGQFNDPNGISIWDGNLFVSDTGNGRIQVLDLEGRFIREWPIPQWQRDAQFFPDVIYDPIAKKVYVTSGKTSELLVFDINGNPVDTPVAEAASALQNPSAMAISVSADRRRLLVVNTVGATVAKFELDTPNKNVRK